MRKVVLSALCAAALLTACNNSGQNKSTLQAQNDSLMLELSNRDTELDWSETEKVGFHLYCR